MDNMEQLENLTEALTPQEKINLAVRLLNDAGAPYTVWTRKDISLQMKEILEDKGLSLPEDKFEGALDHVEESEKWAELSTCLDSQWELIDFAVEEAIDFVMEVA